MAQADLTSPIPAILCGKTLQVGEIVAPRVKPDIESLYGPKIFVPNVN
jgi:hypothetical protein